MNAADDALQRILLTGATSAIGAALAELYARHDVTLYLHGRNAEKLAEVAGRCRAKGAEVITHLLDMRDFAGLQGWLNTLAPLDLVIVNAGMNTHIGPAGEPEPWETVEALVDVNLKAAMVIVQAVLPAMRARGRGQIALVSSLAAYFGLPVTPSYCASKAAIKAYGEALRGWVGPEGIRVNVIMPGYVQSPMCDAMPGPKPFLLQPGKAAQIIHKGLARDQARITFPFPLNLGSWFLALLPVGISLRILRFLNYHG
jgi:short-subunit dehydrogenase